VPEALEVFLEGKDFEDTIRLAISLGGDSDTIGAMAGAIADAYYGVPENIVQQVMPYLSPEMVGSIERLKNRNNV
jgi:type I restriction enzyme M protein